MTVEQFVMAYGVEQDRLRAILPDGFISLRPVLRINAEIIDDRTAYLEFNTAVEKDGIRGWLNIGNWESGNAQLSFIRTGKTTAFSLPFLNIVFTGVEMEGGCPAEKDNNGCFFLGEQTVIRPPEQILSRKEFCDCHFRWSYYDSDASGVSIGKTLPADSTEPVTIYPKQAFTAQNAAAIPCQMVLGSYCVRFSRV